MRFAVNAAGTLQYDGSRGLRIVQMPREGILDNTKHHHIIPCLHLKHFAGIEPAGHVWTYDAAEGRVWSATPEQTAVLDHALRGDEAQGMLDASIERQLKSIESAAAPVYDALLRNEVPGPSQARMDFAHFLGMMLSRTRAMRKIEIEGYGKFIQILVYAYGSNPDAFATAVRKYEEENGVALSPEERDHVHRSILDPSRCEFTVPKEHALPMLALGNKLAPLLYHMKWTVVAARDGYFVSSDNPVVREVHHESVSSMYGDGGFMNPTAEVTFPLSPKKLFLASWREASRLSELPSVLVVRANQCRASQSNRYLYAHVKDARVLDLAALFCDSRSGMTLSDVDPQKFARTAGRSGHA